MQIYYEHAAAKVHYDPDKKYVHTYWEGFCPSNVNREAFEATLQAIIDHKVSKVLFDGAKAKLASPEDQAWILKDWTPRAVAAGYQYYAVVLPKDVFGQFSSKIVIQQADANNPLSSVTTDKVEEAIEWLVAQS